MLGMNIYNLRKTNSMSQEDLAKVLNVSRQAISKWERDESTPDLDKLLIMSKIFGVKVDEIVEGAYDLESYQPLNHTLFGTFDKSSQKLISLGAMIITVLSSLFTLYGLARMYKLIQMGIGYDFEVSGILKNLITDYNALLSIFLISNAILLVFSVVLHSLYKDDFVNKKARYIVMVLGLLLVLSGQQLIGLVYLFLGYITTYNNSEISVKRIIPICIITIILYIVIGILFYNIGGIQVPMSLGGM
ncbi:helix-turn-helix transcriptional regulator [Mycoplasmatota bacterium zrk1]